MVAEEKKIASQEGGTRSSGEMSIVNWILENIEAIAIAFLFALMIRCYFAEVFKIPTVSMNPTLHGDKVSGDKIVVSKFMYHIRPLQRWDVVVFRYPLDMKKNFVKRLIGLPGETIYFSDGDIFYRKKGDTEIKMAKKSCRLQQSIWLPCAVFEKDFTKFYSAWESEDGASVQFPATYESLVVSSKSESSLRFKNVKFEVDKISKQPVLNSTRSNDEFKDIKVEIAGKILSEEGNFTLSISVSNNSRFLLSISKSGIMFSHDIEKDGKVVNQRKERLDKEGINGISREKYFDVEFMHFDGSVYVYLDGKCVFFYSYRNFLGEYEKIDNKNELRIDLKNVTLEIEKLSVWNDIYYKPQRRIAENGNKITIDEGHFFVIGDNVEHSKDSRVWMMKIYKMKDGTIYKCDYDTYRNVFENSDFVEIKRDIYGRNIKIAKSDIASEEVIPAPFISEDAVIGKALSIILPLDRLRLIK